MYSALIPLLFERTSLNLSLAKDIADIINEHPVGFEEVYLQNVMSLGNEGLQAIVDGLNEGTLQNIKDIHIDCGLSGMEGGQAVQSLVKKCGSHLETVDIGNYKGFDLAFQPKWTDIYSMWINCTVGTLHRRIF
eukprot:Platyproteum_vivax@DN7480_c2_g1_i1.p1